MGDILRLLSIATCSCNIFFLGVLILGKVLLAMPTQDCSDASPCLTLIMHRSGRTRCNICLRTALVCRHLAPGTATLCALHSGREAATAMAQATDTESFEFSFNKEVFSDCTVVVTAAEGTKGRKRSWGGLFRSGAERAEFFVTKALLARASPVFRSMIEEQGCEQRGGKTVLHLSVPSSEDFGFIEAMLRHIYTKELTLSAGTAPALPSCASVNRSAATRRTKGSAHARSSLTHFVDRMHRRRAAEDAARRRPVCAPGNVCTWLALCWRMPAPLSFPPVRRTHLSPEVSCM